ncbi:DedA family protein [Aneurinibacillus aneurinilyticus]|jgi:membrane protein DedA with SNARE-associated domain|uniref:DedA family protein n=2 Tax=Aneurinibacillus aneurinilyticus TaxID=1391 RepID=A0A848CND0_ANEAE|nr:DedA family protein [Aneurinibacillus aneurinilyticus]ERI09326.1 SNARE-like domain protein [Aneurinibacillus aneurinilyticus ATCC 12856]MCI1694617.1 DedA family protein [Aneurinibacillus aneurinilyticus]MED0672201.1 DedA family protein [Aneurinibacillus aneurinilyticus]MED0704690.1 DedA family protein [Aneurinibacillus aneurinilyticus]MED0723992.1 DedA family protein [Aneurinibacillus aneurinilyticus]
MAEFIRSALTFLSDLGYFGIAIGLMIEVIPSEIVLSYGGYLVAQGEIEFVGAVIAGVIGGTLAQLFLYWMGYYGGRPFLEKYGKYLLIRKKEIDKAEEWFNRYGIGVIFTARFIPVVRHAISIPAGIARMSAVKFTIYTTLAIIPWSILFVYLGMQLGARWEQIDEFARPFIQPIIWIAIVGTMIYLLFTLRKRKKSSRFSSQ